jgi:hypothetical protein
MFDIVIAFVDFDGQPQKKTRKMIEQDRCGNFQLAFRFSDDSAVKNGMR